jgi:5-methylcytosine-specific restriction endonuclease McrA
MSNTKGICNNTTSTISKRDSNAAKNAVRSAIRTSFTRSEHYKEFLSTKRIVWFKGKRRRVSFKCNQCGGRFGSVMINVDHIEPIGKYVYRGIQDAEYFYNMVYCSFDNLQILCKECHLVKTKHERANPSYANARF